MSNVPTASDHDLNRVAVVFPGQGSRAPGAGQAWVDHPAWAVVAEAEPAARAAGVRKVRALDVGGAFHTPLMVPAAEAFRPTVAATRFAALTTPVVTNHDARPHFAQNCWDDRLSAQLIQPVRWRETVDALAELGARCVVEVGPGTTLSGLVRRCRDDLATASAATPTEVEALLPEVFGVSAR
ncbi:hypothetical protein BH24ACT4_BH24ACT4_15140 [soil metagenome]